MLCRKGSFSGSIVVSAFVAPFVTSSLPTKISSLSRSSKPDSRLGDSRDERAQFGDMCSSGDEGYL
jgi:hypothetical protein